MKQSFAPSSVKFVREKTPKGNYLRNEFDITPEPDVLKFNKWILLHRILCLSISVLWFMLFVRSIQADILYAIDNSSYEFSTRPDIFGYILLYSGLLSLAIFNLDKSVKIWGRIGNFYLKFTVILNQFNTLGILFIWLLNPSILQGNVISLCLVLFIGAGSAVFFKITKQFKVRHSNHMLLTQIANETYKKSLHYRIPVGILSTLLLVFIFSYPIGILFGLFGYNPASIGSSASSWDYFLLMGERAAGLTVTDLVIILLLAIPVAVFSIYDVYIKAEHTAVKRGAFYTPTGAKILVVGAGAIGGISGAYLTMAGENVVLYDTNAAHVEAIRAKGLQITGLRGNLVVKVKVIGKLEELPSDNGKKPVFDVVILAVKSAYTEAAVTSVLPYMNADSAIVTVQNGINDDAIVRIAGESRVIHGITFWGGSNLGPGALEQTSIGHFIVGEIAGETDTSRIRCINQILGNIGITETSPHIHADTWNKLIFNGVMNTYGMIFGERCFELFNNPEILPIVLATIGEETKIAKSIVGKLGSQKMVQMDDLAMDEHSTLEAVMFNGVVLKIISSVSGRIKSSMLQDYERGIRSENRYLLGCFIEQNKVVAQKSGKDPLPMRFIERAYQIAEEIENKRLSTGLENRHKFDDLLLTYPEFWRNPANFTLNSFKNKWMINFYTFMAKLVVKNY